MVAGRTRSLPGASVAVTAMQVQGRLDRNTKCLRICLGRLGFRTLTPLRVGRSDIIICGGRFAGLVYLQTIGIKKAAAPTSMQAIADASLASCLPAAPSERKI